VEYTPHDGDVTYRVQLLKMVLVFLKEETIFYKMIYNILCLFCF